MNPEHLGVINDDLSGIIQRLARIVAALQQHVDAARDVQAAADHCTQIAKRLQTVLDEQIEYLMDADTTRVELNKLNQGETL